MITCQRCEQPIRGEVQHAGREECFLAMQAMLKAARIALLHGRRKILECRIVKHYPNRPLGKTGEYCMACLIHGSAAVEVAAIIVLSEEGKPWEQK